MLLWTAATVYGFDEKEPHKGADQVGRSVAERSKVPRGNERTRHLEECRYLTFFGHVVGGLAQWPR